MYLSVIGSWFMVSAKVWRTATLSVGLVRVTFDSALNKGVLVLVDSCSESPVR